MPNTSGIAVVPAERGPEETEPRGQSQAGRSKTSAAASFERKPHSVRERDRDDLVQPSTEDWKSQGPKVREQCYAQIESDFFGIVNDYLEQANVATDQYKSASLSHRRWRFWTIIATGILAAINVCAALDLLQTPVWGGIHLHTLLNVVAAVYAGGLTVAGNVESFLNQSEQAAGFRESRDILLNRYREYSAKWVYYVEAYGKTPTACMNAGRLYRQLVGVDQELRQKLKQLTEVKQRGKPSGGQR
jgi:hypothetical protein